MPWPPVLAVLEGGVAVGHGRPLSAGRGAQAGAPAEEGGSTVHRHCMRCRPLPASPGPGRGCSPDRLARPVAPGASPRGAPCPPDNEAQSRSTRLHRVVHGPRGLRGPPSGCWGCRSVALQGGAGGRWGTMVLLRQGPPSADVGGTSEGVVVGHAEAPAMQGPDGGGASALLEGGEPSASAGREDQRAPQGPARREGACFPVGEDGVRQTARGSSAAMGVRDPPLRPGSLRAAARDCSVERGQGSQGGRMEERR